MEILTVYLTHDTKMKKTTLIGLGTISLLSAILIADAYKVGEVYGGRRSKKETTSFVQEKSAKNSNDTSKKIQGKNKDYVQEVVYPSTLDFLQKCDRSGISGLSTGRLENVNERDVPGGRITKFSMGDYNFTHTYTTNSLFKAESGDIKILDCDRITYCGLRGSQNPWVAISYGDTGELAQIAQRYSQHGSLEDAERIIINLGKEFNQSKNNLFDPQFVSENDVRGYDLGFVVGIYNSKNELFSGWMGHRNEYDVVPLQNGQGILIQYQENKAQFEDTPPTPSHATTQQLENLLNRQN